ncbi:MAG: hypothetical protein OXH09_16135 [Gammaproteobacteria bacterium]|nr:hypothetical protein [Gammaproteobacteria bacterium]
MLGRKPQRKGVTETFSDALARVTVSVARADFESHDEAKRRYAHTAKGDLTVGELTVPGATLMPDGHEGMDKAEVEFHVTESETTSRRREASGAARAMSRTTYWVRVPTWV